MKKIYIYFIFLLCLIIPLITVTAEKLSINPYIDSLNPKQNAINISRTTSINVYFVQSMNSSTINNTNIKIYGSQKGLINCIVTYNSASKCAIITPQGIIYKPGEIISISLTSGIKTASNVSINPFVYNFTCSASVGPATFTQLSTVNTGSAPEAATTGDFNNDNFIDISVPNLNSNSVSILINNGNGYLTNAQTLSTGNAPRLTVTGDFDMDGDLDVIAINHISNTLNVLSNNGSGNFSVVNTISNSGGPFSITTADFDGDGDLDIAVANYLGSTVFVYKNNGSGGFSYPDSYNVGTGPVCITAGDINNDGNIDLAVAEWNINRISVLINNGNSIFTLLSTHNVGTHPHSISLANIDNDNDLDAIVCNNASNYFNVFFNYNGSFGGYSTFPVGNGSVDAISGDIDGDGDLDIAISNNQSGVSFFFNNGYGNYTLGSSTGVTTGPRRIALADFTSDGILDLAVPNTDFNNVIIFKNGYVPPPAPVLVSPNNGSTGISLTPTFIWYGLSGIINYKIQISLAANFSSILDSAVITTNQYTISSGKLNNSVTYYWRVNATNSYGTGSWSSVWSFTTITLPPAPTLISPANNSIGVSLTPTLYWGALSGITNYKVQISLNSSFASLVDSAIITNNYYLIPSGKLQLETQYFWRVNATNSNGTGSWSAIWNFTTWTTNINLISNEIPNEFKLFDNYPNPFNPETKIRFALPENSFTSILIFDNIGRQISSLINFKLISGTYETVWNGSNLSSGVYYYKIVTEKNTAVKRMILLK